MAPNREAEALGSGDWKGQGGASRPEPRVQGAHLLLADSRARLSTVGCTLLGHASRKLPSESELDLVGL